MEHIYDAVKVFRNEDYVVFVMDDRSNPEIISGMRLLQAEEMAIISWSIFSNYPVEGHLTKKGMDLRDYLKNYEWD